MSREQELEKALRALVDNDYWVDYGEDHGVEEIYDECAFCNVQVEWVGDVREFEHLDSCPIRRAQELLGEEEEKSWVKK